MNRSRLWPVGVWLVCLAIAATIAYRARYLADLSGFLPARPTAADALLVEQLRDGPASRLILAAVEGGSLSQRIQVSTLMAAQLRANANFTSIDNGTPLSAQRDREFLFANRYVLSDRIDPEHFSVPQLHAAFADSVDELASAEGALLSALLPDDPTGETLHILQELQRLPAPALRSGVWVSADTSRALLVAQSAAGGADTDAQQRAIEAVRAAFGAAARRVDPAAGARLRMVLSGPGVFAVDARAKIERAVARLSIVSSTLVVALLFVVYRSWLALALGLLPVVSGALAGVAAVAAGFGVIYGVTLGFGITLIGESVDYSIYFFVATRSSAAGGTPDWTRSWWPTIRLGMLTSVCGFASLLPSGFPGLAQLGAYSISGLLTAALVTRYLLPALLPARFVLNDVAPIGRRLERWIGPLQRQKPAVIAAMAALIAGLALFAILRHAQPLWNRELSALSPISRDAMQVDAQLRADLGTADVRDLIIVTAPTLDAALAAAERTAVALGTVVDKKVIGGLDSPATYLPSLSMQARRRASLPGPDVLAPRVELAAAGLGIRAHTLDPFVRDVEAARRAAPLTERDLQGTSLKGAFEAMVLREPSHVSVLMPLHAAPGAAQIDVDAVRAALAAAPLPATQLIDLKAAADGLYGRYLAEAVRLSLAGLACIVVLLALALRSIARVARVLAPLLLSVLCVAALLTLCGVQLTILHLVGMLLIIAVGSNYTLFFDRQSRHQDHGEQTLTLAALAVANASAVIGFGLLSFSQVPVLVALGTTVAPGAFLALLFGAWLSRA